MLELSGWSWEDVTAQSCLHRTEGLMCRNHRAGLVVKAPRPCTAPGCCWQLPRSLPVGFFGTDPPQPSPSKGRGDLQGGEGEEWGGVLYWPPMLPTLSVCELGH